MILHLIEVSTTFYSNNKKSFDYFSGKFLSTSVKSPQSNGRKCLWYTPSLPYGSNKMPYTRAWQSVSISKVEETGLSFLPSSSFFSLSSSFNYIAAGTFYNCLQLSATSLHSVKLRRGCVISFSQQIQEHEVYHI